MKKTRMLRMLVVMIAVVCVFLFTSCGACSGNLYGTLYDEQKANNQTSAENKIEWVFEQLDKNKISIEDSIKNNENSIATKQDTIASVESQISDNSELIKAKEEELKAETDTNKIQELASAIEELKTKNTNLQNDIVDLENGIKELEKDIEYLKNNALKDFAVELIVSYPIDTGIAGEKKLEKASKNYKVILIKEDVKRYAEYIKNSTEIDSSRYDYSKILEKEKTTCTSCFFSQTNVEALERISAVENGEEKDLYDIVAVFTLQVTERTKEAEPL